MGFHLLQRDPWNSSDLWLRITRREGGVVAVGGLQVAYETAPSPSRNRPGTLEWALPGQRAKRRGRGRGRGAVPLAPNRSIRPRDNSPRSRARLSNRNAGPLKSREPSSNRNTGLSSWSRRSLTVSPSYQVHYIAVQSDAPSRPPNVMPGSPCPFSPLVP